MGWRPEERESEHRRSPDRVGTERYRKGFNKIDAFWIPLHSLWFFTSLQYIELNVGSFSAVILCAPIPNSVPLSR